MGEFEPGPGPRCHYGCGRRVSEAGNVCWACNSYEEYLMAPRCDCPHDPNIECRCEPECEEDCPAYEYGVSAVLEGVFDAGEDAGQGPEGAP
jgi:hypothetical protein